MLLIFNERGTSNALSLSLDKCIWSNRPLLQCQLLAILQVPLPGSLLHSTEPRYAGALSLDTGSGQELVRRFKGFTRCKKIVDKQDPRLILNVLRERAHCKWFKIFSDRRSYMFCCVSLLRDSAQMFQNVSQRDFFFPRERLSISFNCERHSSTGLSVRGLRKQIRGVWSPNGAR